MKLIFMTLFSLLSSLVFANMNCNISLPSGKKVVIKNLDLDTKNSDRSDGEGFVLVKSYPYTYLNPSSGELAEYDGLYTFQIILNYKAIGGTFSNAVNSKKVINLIGNYSAKQEVFELYLNNKGSSYNVVCFLN